MGAIGSVSGKIEASAAIPNQAMCGSEPLQMVQPGSSRRSEANCNSKQVPWGKNPTARWGFSYGSGVAPPDGRHEERRPDSEGFCSPHARDEIADSAACA